MIELKVDMSSLQGQIAGMIRKIDHFKRVDIGKELSDWQVEQMHRHKPFTMRNRARGIASTTIRPHSLWEMTHEHGGFERKTGRRLQSRATRRLRSLKRRLRRWSTRPILRPELYQELIERMNRALGEKLTWSRNASATSD
jgi:hypothetical protein